LFVEATSLYSVQGREIAIQQHPLAAQDDDRTGNAIGVRGRGRD
jgi:hypothetical protein